MQQFHLCSHNKILYLEESVLLLFTIHEELLSICSKVGSFYLLEPDIFCSRGGQYQHHLLYRLLHVTPCLIFWLLQKQTSFNKYSSKLWWFFKADRTFQQLFPQHESVRIYLKRFQPQMVHEITDNYNILPYYFLNSNVLLLSWKSQSQHNYSSLIIQDRTEEFSLIYWLLIFLTKKSPDGIQ